MWYNLHCQKSGFLLGLPKVLAIYTSTWNTIDLTVLPRDRCGSNNFNCVKGNKKTARRSNINRVKGNIMYKGKENKDIFNAKIIAYDS